jgi:hypothetical protein
MKTKARVFSVRIRKALIRLLAGDMGVVLNASLGKEPNGEPYIAYASKKGGMCELSGVK